MDEEFELTPVDRNSETWGKLLKYMERRLEKLRERNDARLDGTETAELRGAIRELKLLISFNTDIPKDFL